MTNFNLLSLRAALFKILEKFIHNS